MCTSQEDANQQPPDPLPPCELGQWKYDQRLSDTAPISELDRFAARGFVFTGVGGGNNPADPGFAQIMTPEEIGSALQRLEDAYPLVKLDYSSHDSWLGQKTRLAYLQPPAKRTRSTPSYDTFFTGGFQGRERGTPDSLIYFMADLLHARDTGEGLSYGDVSYTHKQVMQALDKGVIFMPLANPDGLTWDQKFHNCYAGNVNLNTLAAGHTFKGAGVNLDRNFDIAWDYRKLYSPSVTPGVASDDPADELYHGRKAFSEPESRNVEDVFKKNSKLSKYVNVGGRGRLVGYPWASSPAQTCCDWNNWRNKDWDGKRGETGAGYAEYMDKDDLDVFRRVSGGVAERVRAVRGGLFVAGDDAGLEMPASGTATDWAYSRHITRKKHNKVFSYQLQYGLVAEDALAVVARGGCQYYPTSEQYKNMLTEAAVGFMEVLLAGADKE
ncbi:peptidase m14 [Colletotrichum plurivorum]|uniref:Peptidase m14 n=1 Tax=Colletotrichum plurivorum TaxID=2175906 RepID=A0A8H6KDY4_9PEZI|nr:peptidase m14 [Colletotrichum plurivorum]